MLKADVTGWSHSPKSGAAYVYGTIESQFYRPIGQDVQCRNLTDITPTIKVITEGTPAATDFTFDREEDPNTVTLKVTGVADIRMVWTASVEVQRISDKTYER